MPGWRCGAGQRNAPEGVVRRCASEGEALKWLLFYLSMQHDYVIRMAKEGSSAFFIPNDRKKYSVGENAGRGQGSKLAAGTEIRTLQDGDAAVRAHESGAERVMGAAGSGAAEVARSGKGVSNGSALGMTASFPRR
jgi:hypothetical protein